MPCAATINAFMQATAQSFSPPHSPLRE